MNETSRVVITRPRWAARDLLRAYRVFIDDDACGKIKQGQQISVDITPGLHTAIARIDHSGSPPIDFVAEPGQTIHLEVAPAGNGFQFWQAYTSKGYLRLTLLPPVS